jgi:outer membrane autotransporter protein
LTAEYSDDVLSASLTTSRRYDFFLPSAGVELVQIWTPKFSESGGAAALRTDKSSYTSVELPIGFRLNKTFCHRLTPEFRAFWVPQIGDRSSQVVTSFTNGGPNFVADSGDFGWQHTRVGTGLTARLGRCWTASANYDAAFYTGNQTVQTAAVGLTARF